MINNSKASIFLMKMLCQELSDKVDARIEVLGSSELSPEQYPDLAERVRQAIQSYAGKPMVVGSWDSKNPEANQKPRGPQAWNFAGDKTFDMRSRYGFQRFLLKKDKNYTLEKVSVSHGVTGNV